MLKKRHFSLCVVYFSERQSYPDADRKEVKRTLDQKKTGQFLKALRNEKNLTQEQLAKQFNVSNRSVSRWETGSNLPDISLLVEIADFYDVDVREIIDGERRGEEIGKDFFQCGSKTIGNDFPLEICRSINNKC